jgi:hypothetical protein
MDRQGVFRTSGRQLGDYAMVETRNGNCSRAWERYFARGHENGLDSGGPPGRGRSGARNPRVPLRYTLGFLGRSLRELHALAGGCLVPVTRV